MCSLALIYFFFFLYLLAYWFIFFMNLFKFIYYIIINIICCVKQIKANHVFYLLIFQKKLWTKNMWPVNISKLCSAIIATLLLVLCCMQQKSDAYNLPGSRQLLGQTSNIVLRSVYNAGLRKFGDANDLSYQYPYYRTSDDVLRLLSKKIANKAKRGKRILLLNFLFTVFIKLLALSNWK